MTCPLCRRFLMQPSKPSRMTLSGYLNLKFDLPPSWRGALTLSRVECPGVRERTSHGRRSCDDVCPVSDSTITADSHRSTISRTSCIPQETLCRDVQSSPSQATFKSRLKTHLFNIAFAFNDQPELMLRNVLRASGSVTLASGALQIGLLLLLLL